MTTVLAIDQGTTNSKALLVDQSGKVLAQGSAPMGVHATSGGRVEQDADEVWASTCAAIEACLAGRPAPDAVAISNQRESVLVWRRDSGRAAGPVLGWQDTRTAAWCRDHQSDDRLVRQQTGLPLDSMFSAPKLRWLLDQVGGGDDLAAGTIDSWLVHRLTGGAVHATDAGNASRTLLFDVAELDWSDELCQVFGIPRSVLPEVRRSDAEFGVTRGVPGLPDGVPVLGVMADSHAALFGHGCERPGTAKATYGTGSSVMSPTAGYVAGESPVPLTLAWLTDHPQYAREGNITSSGAALDWTARTLGLPSVRELLALAAEVPDSDGVAIVPALAGLGAPHWARHATANISGLTQASLPAHIARACVDAVAHQICDIVDIIDTDQGRLAELRADGGATASDLLMQTQADLAGRPVIVTAAPEVSAVGAARMALRHRGLTIPDPVPRRVHEPAISEDERQQRRATWRSAVRLVVG